MCVCGGGGGGKGRKKRRYGRVREGIRELEEGDNIIIYRHQLGRDGSEKAENIKSEGGWEKKEKKKEKRKKEELTQMKGNIVIEQRDFGQNGK